MITFTDLFIVGGVSIILLAIFMVLFYIIDKIKLGRLKKKYDEKEDKSRQGEKLGRGGRNSGYSDRRREETTPDTGEYSFPSRRISLPTSDDIERNLLSLKPDNKSGRKKKRTLRRRGI